MKVSDLCNEVLTYILSISISNKSGTYTQSGYLAVNGDALKTYTQSVQYSAEVIRHTGVVTTKTVTQNIRTSETINSAYLAQVTNTRITADWNAFKDTYISKILGHDQTITISSLLILIYLVRCFVDTRFTLFTDTYHKSYVWLYNTSTSVDYKVNNNITNTLLKQTSATRFDNLNTIISSLTDEISSRRSIYVLKSSFSTTVS